MRTVSMLAGATLLALLSISVSTSTVGAQAAADPTTASIKSTFDIVTGVVERINMRERRNWAA